MLVIWSGRYNIPVDGWEKENKICFKEAASLSNPWNVFIGNKCFALLNVIPEDAHMKRKALTVVAIATVEKTAKTNNTWIHLLQQTIPVTPPIQLPVTPPIRPPAKIQQLQLFGSLNPVCVGPAAIVRRNAPVDKQAQNAKKPVILAIRAQTLKHIQQRNKQLTLLDLTKATSPSSHKKVKSTVWKDCYRVTVASRLPSSIDKWVSEFWANFPFAYLDLSFFPPTTANLLRNAVQSILIDRGFRIKSSNAREVLRSAENMMLEWVSDKENQVRVAKFCEELHGRLQVSLTESKG